MSSLRKIDTSTLGWVKSEIEETLKQARLALESYAENPAESTRLRFGITYLHQVYGTLQMVELDGAAVLARENELLAEALLDGRVASQPAVFEILTRGLLTLPDYLARLEYGQADAPMRLLPLINELRAARQAAPLSEIDLFNPDLSVRPPGAGERHKLTDEEFRALARAQRPLFQTALLDWLRDAGNGAHLERADRALSVLQAQAPVGIVELLFWVAGGLLEALARGDLEPTNARKKLLARLDQQIKRLADGGDKAPVRTAGEALIKSLLLELGEVRSPGARVDQLKRAFDLDLLLTGVPAEIESPALYELPTPEALHSVAQALGKEIESAQDILSAYFDPAQEDVTSLAPLLELLHKMSGTLALLGVGLLKTLVDELMAVCSAIVEGRIADPASVSMPMAGALLLLESSTRDMPRPGGAWKKQVEETVVALRALPGAAQTQALDGIEISDAVLSDSEFRQLLGVVASEIRVNLGRVEELLETFAATPEQLAPLESVPQHLNQIQGALQILGQERAAELTAAVHRHIQNIRGGRQAVDDVVLDALAVSIGAIGAYVDGLERDRPNLGNVLDIAWRDLQRALGGEALSADPLGLLGAIERNLRMWLQDGADHATRQILRKDLSRMAQLAVHAGEQRIESLANEMGRLLAVMIEDRAPLTSEITHTLGQSLEALAGLVRTQLAVFPGAGGWAVPGSAERLLVTNTGEAPAEPGATATSASSPGIPEDLDELDSEIMQIFIEDAHETLGVIDQRLADWRARPDDREALLELRRGFHTLKGSGRMVGAGEIAELAWALENVLNQVREGRLAGSGELLELVQAARAVLPEMVAQLEGGPAPQADVAALRARAEALARSAVSARLSESGPDAVAAVEVEELPRPDPALLQIYTNETRGHLGTIRAILQEARAAGGSCPVTEPLLRAAHTLQGGSRSLGLRAMAEACAEMEKLLQAVAFKQAPLSEVQLGLLERVADNVARMLEALNAGDASSGELQREFARLARNFSEENALLSSGESPPEPFAAHSAESTARSAIRPRAASAGAVPGNEQGDPELLEVFVEEAADILNVIEQALTRWRNERSDLHAAQELMRSLHTLKGGARMAGALAVAGLAHNTESLLRHLEENRAAPDADLLDLLDEVYDALLAMIDQVQSQRPVGGVAELNARIRTRLDLDRTAGPEEETPEQYSEQDAEQDRERTIATLDAPATVWPPPPGPPGGQRPSRGVLPALFQAAPKGEADTPARRSEDFIRMRTGVLNNLVNYAGEVSIARSRMQQQIFGFREGLGELKSNIGRFRDQIRELEIQSESQILYRAEQDAVRAGGEFDPLEFDRYSRLQTLSRSLAESLHDLFTIQSNLDNHIGDAETVLQQQARVGTELQEGLTRSRMIGFSTLAARLRHIVRQTARELGKQAELRIGGAEVEIDRNVLERMIGPFEHMIRNSLDHGIENPSAREHAGKPAVATIGIDIRHEGSEVIIRFSDDGAGLDIGAIRAKAVERGLIKPGVNLADEELIQFILVAGFSTADRVTQLSGRGIGMDVVHNEVKQLGGGMTVETRAGAGTTFTIRLPLTLSITQALMVYVDEQVFALPLPAVANILEVSSERLPRRSAGSRPLLSHDDQVYPFLHLGTRLGLTTEPHVRRKAPVLLVKSGGRQLAMQVDRLGGTQELVIKPLGPQLSALDALAGAAILGDGRVVLILNTAGLWLTEELMHAAPPVPEPPAQRPLIMVVDDSITVRKVTGRHLQKRGLEVVAAKDGIEALELLRDRLPDLMLVDIEMPRMDGYELTGAVRADPKLRHIPIIVITSRAGAKHRERAIQLGANRYLTKPYQEDELLRNIEALLARHPVH